MRGQKMNNHFPSPRGGGTLNNRGEQNPSAPCFALLNAPLSSMVLSNVLFFGLWTSQIG